MTATKLPHVTVGHTHRRALQLLHTGDYYTVNEAVHEAASELDVGPELADFIAALVIAVLTDRHTHCSECGGELCGQTERALGSCGHCGGRSRRP